MHSFPWNYRYLVTDLGVLHHGELTEFHAGFPVYHENWTPVRNGPPWLGVHFSWVNQPMRNGPHPQLGAV